MRVRRRRRRLLAAVLAVVYLGVFAWLVSPLWRSPHAPATPQPAVRGVRSGGLVGLAPLGDAKPLPVSLSSSSPAGESESSAGESGSEVVVGSDAESTTSTPEVSKGPAGTPSSGESTSSSSGQTIIGGEG